MEDNLKKVTKHRMSQPPWITSKTSYLQNLLKIKKRKKKNTFNVSQALNNKELEKQVNKSIENNLKLYEAKVVFETRYFSHIQKYPSCIRKSAAMLFNTTDTTQDADFSRNVFNWFRIDQSNVFELLQEYNIRKSTGPDGIENIMLKNAADGISKPLTFVYQTIVNKVCFPTQWKLCHVCPVFKDGNKKDVSCYRPISPISCVSKVFERILFVWSHLFFCTFLSACSTTWNSKKAVCYITTFSFP